MWFGVVTLFPEMLAAVTACGVTGRACRNGLIEVHAYNPRDFARDKFRTVDDKPYGGGPGMLMKVQPLSDAIATARAAAPSGTRIVCLSPQGRRLDHSLVTEFHSWGAMILVAGRYEGIDERILESEVDLEVSVGDFVVSGGELPAMCIIDAVSRMVPGVLGNIENAQGDTFAQGLLHYPQYTRPESIGGRRVPEVLMSGDHARIREWRLMMALGRTWERRPDLLGGRELSAEERDLLQRYQAQRQVKL
ncbi:MAG: tRNA (guanosine(37)-N1)-methyltransferase TrmD [Succinivibrionaceae bacterium]|nr:tRNA (guanosine(37)-N1)-methyltransferase TrmD [Succinivibrionaceae bacterium]